MSAKTDEWVVDKESPHKSFQYAVEKTFVSGKTKFQDVSLVLTPSYGRVLLLDGRLQSTEIDEGVYHEYLVQPVMCHHPEPKNILILGAGEGATGREVYKHPSVEKCVMVDIDEELIGFIKDHMQSWHEGSFDDARTELIFGDARKFVEETSEKFDVVIIDICEPVAEGPAVYCYTREFYAAVKEILNPGGLVAVQSDAVNIDSIEIHPYIYSTLSDTFGQVATEAYLVYSFNCLWSTNVTGLDMEIENFYKMDVGGLISERNLKLNHYDGISHIRNISLPKHVRASHKDDNEVFTDSSINGIIKDMSINKD